MEKFYMCYNVKYIIDETTLFKGTGVRVRRKDEEIERSMAFYGVLVNATRLFGNHCLVSNFRTRRNSAAIFGKYAVFFRGGGADYHGYKIFNISLPRDFIYTLWGKFFGAYLIKVHMNGTF